MPFDEFLNSAQSARSKPVDKKQPPTEEKARRSQPKNEEPSVQQKASPWADLQSPEKTATVRLNVDIPIELNDRLAEKARQLRKPKTELVRRLLEWALKESDE
ncbi:MAG TPA: hypothetical protein V6C65_11785 [Allocoleopsis sp.]